MYVMTPTDHMSTFSQKEVPINSSGAAYPGILQIDSITVPQFTRDKAKLATYIYILFYVLANYT